MQVSESAQLSLAQNISGAAVLLFQDLQHPNEFIRGSTLRFLCKLKEPELLEPLMPAIRSCLEHRHSYVRRNAVLAIYTIYRNFDALIPDAPELIANFLDAEQDASCKRNAFMMLIHADQVSYPDMLYNQCTLCSWVTPGSCFTIIRQSFKSLSEELIAFKLCSCFNRRALYSLLQFTLLLHFVSNRSEPSLTWAAALTRYTHLVIFYSWSLLS